MKTLRKTKKCLNCGQVLSETYSYCPLCGQENTDNNVSFSQLIGDFFSNYFSIDSKFVLSIKPFFIKPGHLTNSFNNGKRKSYANPVRLYIIISFFYFFILSFLVSDLSESVPPLDANQVDIDSLNTEVFARIDSSALSKINQNDSALHEIIKKYDLEKTSDNNLNIETGGDWPLTSEEWDLFVSLIKIETLTDQQIFDSLNIEYRQPFTQHVIKQMIRVYKSDKEYLFAFVIKNFSLMMFIMLPVFALILKLLYIRRKTLYINHLVHSLHIHSFSFLIYGLTVAISIWIFDSDWIELIALLLVTIYSYISFRTVYNQGHKKTLIKFLLTGTVYSIVMFFAFLIEVFISVLIF